MDYDYWLRIGLKEPFHYLQGYKLAGSRMYQDNKTMAFRLPVHREILKVVRRKTETPYRWLKVLADISTRNDGQEFCDNRYAKNILKLAHEYFIPLDGPMLADIVGSLIEKQHFVPCEIKRYNISKFLIFKNKLKKIYSVGVRTYVFKLLTYLRKL